MSMASVIVIVRGAAATSEEAAQTNASAVAEFQEKDEPSAARGNSMSLEMA
jgi:hypothetical protein